MAATHQAENERSLPSIPLHLAGFITLFAAILAVSSTLYAPGFTFATAVTAAAGNAISWFLRRQGYSMRLLEIVVIGVVVILYAKLAAGFTANETIMPAATRGSMELKLAVVLLWMEVFRSFSLTSDYAVIFTAVPSVALLGLMATENVNTEMLMFFVMYLIPAVFMMIHRTAMDVEHVCGDEKKLLREQIRAAIALGAIAVTIGTIVVTPIRLVSTGFFGVLAPQWLNAASRPGIQSNVEPGMLPISQGPVRLSGVTVMIVRGNPPGALAAGNSRFYWRGRVFDHYTGHGWISSFGYRDVEPTGQPVIENDSAYFVFHNPHGPTGRSGAEELEHEIEVVRGPFSTLYAMSEPKIIWSKFNVISRDRNNNWHGRMATSSTNRYKVLSVLPETDAKKLKKAGTNYPRFVKRFYLQKTNTVKAAQLAQHVTRGQDTPYEKAAAVAGYLSSNYTYDINAAPAPSGGDVVEYFLFNSRTGYCDVFASSMVVMLRELGIPARLATGFAEGTYEPELHGFRVRELDRHAWVEVYFPNYGWVPFDPTGSSGAGSGNWTAGISRFFSWSYRLLTSSGMVSVTLLLVLAALMMYLLNIEDRWLRFPRLRRRRRRATNFKSLAVREYETLCKHLRKSGIEGRADDTPGEYMLEAAQVFADLRCTALLESLSARFGRIRYSEADATESDLLEMRREIGELRQAIRERKQ